MLASFGVSIRDHSFDTSVITPGVVAGVGGLLLIGLGLTLRVLQRIEHALATRALSRAEPAFPAQAERQASLQPSASASHPQTAPVVAVATAAVESVSEEASARSPLLARLEATRAIAETDAPRSPNPTMPFPTSVDIAVAQVDKVQDARRKNGAGTARVAPRLGLAPRPPVASDRSSAPSFEALWPRADRSARTGQAAPTPAPAAQPQTNAEPEATQEPAVAAAETPALAVEAEAVSVLKSGVVDGMGYTLYSDGSIEAQLPQGALRFGSIADLRNHIERSA